MKITSALTKIPWFKILRYLPGIIGISGELLQAGRESEQADAIKRIENQQKVIADSIPVLESRIRLVFWIAVAALTIALAALVVALVK